MQTLKNKEKIDSTLQDQAAPCVNVSGTDRAIDTHLTQRCSPTVHADALRRKLTVLRLKLGARSPAGHRCSTLIEQLEKYCRTTDEWQQTNLAKGIKEQLDQLAELTSSR